MLALDEYSASLGLTLLVLGAGSALPWIAPTSPWPRALLCLVSVVLQWRYASWRLCCTVPAASLSLETVVAWGFALLEMVTVISATLAILILARTRDRSAEATRHAGWEGADTPRVDVYIVTYNEERSVLERTIAGALDLDYPSVNVFVLDDGRRPWLARWCHSLGIGYLTRPARTHAKAGNINNAFARRRAEPDAPEFIAILDADFVPHRDFLRRAMALFHDSRTALVQTPQHFFNPDPIQHNLGISRWFPNEQRFFFDHVEPSRDAWGIAACAGTSCIIRATALEKIGGVPTGSVTEDFLLSLTLAERGWRTVYLAEPLSEGLAPEGLQEYIIQRTRWCLGMMQIARGRFSPCGRHRLGLLQRIGVLDSLLYWATVFPFRLASLVCPLLYWFFGVLVVDASLSDVLRYFLPAYAANLLVLNWLSRGLVLPVVTDVSLVVAAWPVSRAVLSGLFRSGPQRFAVTPKGGDRSRAFVHWRLLMPFLAGFLITLIGLSLVLLSDYPRSSRAGDGELVVLVWTMYNLIVLALACAASIEQPRAAHPLAEQVFDAVLTCSGRAAVVWASEVSTSRARVRGAAGLRSGSSADLRLRGIGDVPAVIEGAVDDGYVLTLRPTAHQRRELLACLHARGGSPGVLTARARQTYAALLSRLLIGWQH